MEPSLTDRRPPSAVPSDLSDAYYDHEDDAGELWDELDTELQAQEDHFIEQDGATLMG